MHMLSCFTQPDMQWNSITAHAVEQHHRKATQWAHPWCNTTHRGAVLHSTQCSTYARATPHSHRTQPLCQGVPPNDATPNAASVVENMCTTTTAKTTAGPRREQHPSRPQGQAKPKTRTPARPNGGPTTSTPHNNITMHKIESLRSALEC